MNQSRISKDSGFTLIESMIALAVLAITLLGLKGVLALGENGKHGPGGHNKDHVGNHYFGKGEATTAGVQKGS